MVGEEPGDVAAAPRLGNKKRIGLHAPHRFLYQIPAPFVDQAGQVEPESIDVKLLHPPDERIDDDFPDKRMSGVEFVSGAAPVHEIPRLVFPQGDLPEVMAERVDVEEGGMVVDHINQYGYPIAMQLFDKILQFGVGLGLPSGDLVRTAGEGGVVSALRSEEKGGHVPPVVEGGGVPGVVKPLRSFLAERGFDPGKLVEGKKLHRIHTESFQVGDPSGLIRVEPLPVDSLHAR